MLALDKLIHLVQQLLVFDDEHYVVVGSSCNVTNAPQSVCDHLRALVRCYQIPQSGKPFMEDQLVNVLFDVAGRADKQEEEG